MLAAALAAASLLAGCKSTPKAQQGGYFLISAQQAEFFKYGPAQSFGPDFMLSKGERVLMLDRSWGFSRVMTDSGVSGFVSSDQLEPAPAPPPEPTKPKPSRRSGGGGGFFFGKPRQSNVEPVPSDPLFNVNDVPLPLPDEPELPTNKPDVPEKKTDAPERKPDFRVNPNPRSPTEPPKKK
jgi:hypothetical protein